MRTLVRVPSGLQQLCALEESGKIQSIRQLCRVVAQHVSESERRIHLDVRQSWRAATKAFLKSDLSDESDQRILKALAGQFREGLATRRRRCSPAAGRTRR